MKTEIVMLIVFFSVDIANFYKLSIGECTVYYEEPCQIDLVRFYLYMPHTYNVRNVMLNPFNPLLPSDFNTSTPTKIIIHGYAGSEATDTITSIPWVYTNIGYQAIMVDWSSLAKAPCYPAAFLNTWHVGQCIAILASTLTAFGLMPNQLHALGFSLGAHIASFASNHLRKVVGMPFGRITGLDPALPFFASYVNEWKLDPSDADFVDVIHTNAGSFGKIEPIGHVDFYVNGGSLQPACENNYYAPKCSHLMVNVYYAESIVSKKFLSTECASFWDFLFGYCHGSRKRIAVMGEHCEPSTRGVYFLNTATSPPYGLG